jgi:hypothetical protein
MRFTSRHWAYFAAFLFTSLALGPSLAHLLELLNKISLSREQYFTVQGIYRGWALLGIVILGELISLLTLAFLLRRERWPLYWALLTLVCVVGAQAIFWIWTYPTNVATNNWTEIPDNWQALRVTWEYSHAVAACLNIIGMMALVLSVLSWRDSSTEIPVVARGPQV